MHPVNRKNLLPQLNIKKLQKSDATQFHAFRLSGLKETPENFGSSYDEEKEYTLERIESHFENGAIFGCFEGDDLIGVTGYYAIARKHMAHVARIWGVYVHPDMRRQGVSKMIFEAILDDIPDGIEQIRLGVSAQNTAAKSLYESVGFKECGREDKLIKIGDQYYDEILMVKFLK